MSRDQSGEAFGNTPLPIVARFIRPDLAFAADNALPAAVNHLGQINGLQRVLLEERGRLIRFLAARGAGEDAEDLLHDLWQRITITAANPVAEPLAYLFRAAENLVRDRRRSNVSRDRRQQAWYETGPTADEQPGGERLLIARERLLEAEAALSALGTRVETVFRRYRLEGVGQATIARELGVSLSSVEKDLQKAYRALAQLKARHDAE